MISVARHKLACPKDWRNPVSGTESPVTPLVTLARAGSPILRGLPPPRFYPKNYYTSGIFIVLDCLGRVLPCPLDELWQRHQILHAPSFPVCSGHGTPMDNAAKTAA
jgi:hypothetical protein